MLNSTCVCRTIIGVKVFNVMTEVCLEDLFLKTRQITTC